MFKFSLPWFTAAVPDDETDESFGQLIPLMVRHCEGYVETLPIRIFYTDPDPNNPKTRQFTRLEPIIKGDEIAEVAKMASNPNGIVTLYIRPEVLSLGMDIENSYAQERAAVRAKQIANGADPDRVDFADRAGTGVLPVQTVEMPGYLETFGYNFPAPGKMTGAQAIMPAFTFNLPMDDRGKLFNQPHHYIDRWAEPIPPADDPNGDHSLKITTVFEYRVLRWKLGWPNE